MRDRISEHTATALAPLSGLRSYSARRWWRRSTEGELFNASESKPDFYLHKTSDWLVLPYEMLGLTVEEIAEHKPFLMPMLETAGVKGN